ncbi:hypothetical protein CCUG60884_02774 [Mycobacteroides salmoniphilum]|uniref:Uncharacterized protein n=1 Tax=Mycobacteroides salmoniphilum TaxID=404941 RepID=A0A4R8STW1_9MYCO|nr:hypothetical protein CCUG60884_02774 [Mycobacteroides salmoniphilum]
MLAYQRKFFTDREQRLCLGKDCGVPQEPVLVVCTVVLDHVQRKVQYSALGALPQLIDTLSLFVSIHPDHPYLPVPVNRWKPSPHQTGDEP